MTSDLSKTSAGLWAARVLSRIPVIYISTSTTLVQPCVPLAKVMDTPKHPARLVFEEKHTERNLIENHNYLSTVGGVYFIPFFFPFLSRFYIKFRCNISRHVV